MQVARKTAPADHTFTHHHETPSNTSSQHNASTPSLRVGRDDELTILEVDPGASLTLRLGHPTDAAVLHLAECAFGIGDERWIVPGEVSIVARDSEVTLSSDSLPAGCVLFARLVRVDGGSIAGSNAIGIRVRPCTPDAGRLRN